jgi:predicted phage baseplate assembly protein
MALPAPDLDDRRFQDLVDDAKRLVQRRCPEWTDHNVSDPGVTLIEAFAQMTDQTVYRLNRVPDRLYVKFLELLGLQLLPPVPAVAPVTFWLSAPATSPLTVSAGTAAATLRTDTTSSVVFSTLADLVLLPCSLTAVTTRTANGTAEPRGDDVRLGRAFPAFSTPPQPDDSLCLGLSQPVPGCAVRVDFRGPVDGIGVDPTDPPLVWEAWDGAAWVGCLVSTDETGGLSRSGGVVVHLPVGHAASVVDGQRAAWLRARVVPCADGQPAYSSPPVVAGLSACTVGGTADAVHAELVQDEDLGVAEGVAGQRFTLARTPVVTGPAPLVVHVSSEAGWQQWHRVDSLADSGPDDRHFLLDGTTGSLQFGTAVRLPDGSVRAYGAVPDAGAQVRAAVYATGGGARGNVGRGALRTLKASIPFVAGVENLRRAHDGADGETVEQAKQRAPVLLRTSNRAVTAEDFETLGREAAPELARVRCLPAGDEGADAGSVRLLVVPGAPDDDGRLVLGHLVPSEATLRRVAERLDAARLVGTRVHVSPPYYQGVTVVARLQCRADASPPRVQAAALDALYRYLHPLSGGPEGRGWAFGRAVHAGEVFAVLQAVRGVDVVEEARLFGANPVTGERGPEAHRVELRADSLVFSYGHQVRVEQR